MSKWFYILTFIFAPMPAIYFGWVACNYEWIPIMKALVLSIYICNAILLLMVRLVGGPEKKIN